MAIPPTRAQGDSGHIQDHNDISTELSARLPLSGGTLTGTLNGTSAVFSGSLQAASGTFSGNISAATPTQNGHVATKQYVDNNTSPSIAYAAYAGTFSWEGQNVPGGVPLTPIHQKIAEGLAANITITFPVGRFTQSPIVTIANTTDDGMGIYGSLGVRWVYSNSVTVRIYNSGPQNTSFNALTFSIIALQMTSTSGAG